MQTEIIKDKLEEYLINKGIDTNKNFSCINPEHTDKHPSMSYNKKGNYVHCFACGKSYDIFDIIGIDYKLNTFKEKYQKACEIFNLTKDEKKYKVITRTLNLNKGYSAITDKSMKRDSNETQKFIKEEYLKSTDRHYFYKRGISEKTIKKYTLFIKDSRAYLPIRENDIIIAYAARATEEGTEPRYKNSRGPMGIFNADYIKEPVNDDLYVCEGIFDALSLEEIGLKAIAINGAANVNKLMQKCKEAMGTARNKRFIIVPDNDNAGGNMAKELSKSLMSEGIECSVMKLDSMFKDANEMLLADKEGLKKLALSAAEDFNERYNNETAAAFATVMLAELEKKGSAAAIATGFEQLDNYLDGGLFAGLYIVGAVSSLGKTTFVLQTGGNIAANGTDVLIFSLEMSKYELISKSVSRISYKIDKENVLTAREILRGDKYSEYRVNGRYALLNDAVESYISTEGKNLFIKEGLCDIGSDEIRQAVREHIHYRGKKPVVIIDYLQIIKPVDARATDKQNTDRAVTELKRISRDFDVPVIAVSSFNRDNYKSPVTMEAFKESGAVEYSSDVLIGLQLAGVGTQNFNLNEAKKKEPRDIELVMLKNRNGIAHGVVEFSYTAKYNCFTEKAKEKPKKINRL